MPGGLPIGLELANASETGTTGGTTFGTKVTGSATANTKGSYTTIIASTPSDTCWMIVRAIIDSSVADIALDIAVGASGQEVVLVNNLMITIDRGTDQFFTYSFPIQIPAGTRVAGRAQSNPGGLGVDVSIVLLDGAFTQMEGSAGVDSVGFVAASTRGTAVTPGASTTKGSYAQLIASTARDYIGFLLEVDAQGTSFPASSYVGYVDIAIGASGSEKIILPNCPVILSASGNATVAIWPDSFVSVPIPAGSRVAARANTILNSAVTFGLTLYGVYQ